MSLGTLSSRVLGLIRDQVMVSLFPKTVTDAFIVAFRLPNLFRRLLGEGALSVSFIPIFIECRSQNGEEEAKQLFFAVQAILFCAAGSLSVLGVIFMEPLMTLLLDGDSFQGVAGKFDRTVVLARIMFSYLFLVTHYAFGMAVLNSFKRFFIPALAPAFFNLSIIGFALVPTHWGRVPGEFLAWGVLFGGIVQALMIFVPLAQKGFWPRWRRLQWSRSIVTRLRLILKNMIPGVMGMGVLQLMAILNVQFASRLKEGAHSYIYLADRILELPQSLIAISLGAALLPTLSEYSAQQQREKMLEVTQSYLRILLFLALPSAVGMYILAEPIVKVLFGRGEFGAQEVVITASVIRIYSFLLLASGINKVLIPNFYAIQNTWLPALASTLSLLVHFFLAPFLMAKYGLQGLVLSTTLAGGLNVSTTFVCLNLMVGRINFSDILLSTLRFVPGLLLMGGFAFYGHSFLVKPRLGSGFLFEALSLGGIIGGSVVLYFTAGYILKVPEVLRFVKRKKMP